jgi:cysteine desulfurase/selenocysteine lyase
MIHSVSIEKTTFAPIPNRFEAGTPHISGAIGLGAAVDFIQEVGISEIHKHCAKLTSYAYKRLMDFPHIHILGPQNADSRLGIIAFTHDKIHPHDLSSLLAQKKVCIRAGHHCAMPLHTSLHSSSSARMSFSVYTSIKDIDVALSAIESAEKTMKV